MVRLHRPVPGQLPGRAVMPRFKAVRGRDVPLGASFVSFAMLVEARDHAAGMTSRDGYTWFIRTPSQTPGPGAIIDTEEP